MVNLPVELLNKLQKLQNQAARIILKKPYREHITPSLMKLHWLPVKARLTYKTAVLCYKCLNGIAPPYLANLIQEYNPTRNLRSTHRKQLVPKQCKYKRIGNRAFSCYAPTTWNSLPLEVRKATTLTKFQTLLKTHLFKTSYNT